MAISNHHALSEATCISRARRFKSSLGHENQRSLTRRFSLVGALGRGGG